MKQPYITFTKTKFLGGIQFFKEICLGISINDFNFVSLNACCSCKTNGDSLPLLTCVDRFHRFHSSCTNRHIRFWINIYCSFISIQQRILVKSWSPISHSSIELFVAIAALSGKLHPFDVTIRNTTLWRCQKNSDNHFMLKNWYHLKWDL